MQTHAIVEIEDGALGVVVGSCEGTKAHILRSKRLPLADLGRDSVTHALRAIGNEELAGARTVHVVLGERRMQHFLSTAPQMSPADVLALVDREALRLTNQTSRADVLVAPRLLQRLPGRKLLLGTTALARSVWEPIAEAFRANNLEVKSLQSMESCLALAADGPRGERTAVLEVNSGRARLVMSECQSPLQVRRFLIGGGSEQNSSALTTQLAMELPRTFDWLRESSHALPTKMVLGTRVTIDDDDLSMLKCDQLQTIVRAGVEVYLEEQQVLPSLAVLMLLRQIASARPLPSLLDAPGIELPWNGKHLVGIAAMVVAGFACSWSAIVDGWSWRERREVHLALADEVAQLEAEIGVSEGAAAQPAAAASEHEQRLQKVLSMRRPISRLVADISGCAAPGMHLDELKFASMERLVITGFVQGKTRTEALASMATFARRVRDLAYVLADGQEEISEVAGQRNRFRFRLTLSWRFS